MSGLVGSDSENRSFVVHFDGATWQRVASENTPASSSDLDRLESVSALNSMEVWAVGFATDIFYDPNHREVSSTLALRQISDSGPTPTSVVSRKLHNGVPCDINLPLAGNPGIESRSGGETCDYQLVFSFASAVSANNAAITAGLGSISSMGDNGMNTVTVNLTGITNAQRIKVTLFGVSDGTMTRNLDVEMGVLVGDTNGDGSVNAADTLQTRSRSGQSTNATNLRNDVNIDGVVNGGDSVIVRNRSGTSLP